MWFCTGIRLDRNEVTNGGMLAITGAKFTFHGVAAHAAMAPDRGRSALDAVMLMERALNTCASTYPAIHAFITSSPRAAWRRTSRT